MACGVSVRGAPEYPLFVKHFFCYQFSIESRHVEYYVVYLWCVVKIAISIVTHISLRHRYTIYMHSRSERKLSFRLHAIVVQRQLHRATEIMGNAQVLHILADERIHKRFSGSMLSTLILFCWYAIHVPNAFRVSLNVESFKWQVFNWVPATPTYHTKTQSTTFAAYQITVNKCDDIFGFSAKKP